MNYQEEIQKELARAQAALEAKNEGKVRVCCRRAAGLAIRRWLASQPEPPAWVCHLPKAQLTMRRLSSRILWLKKA
jgi:hypothetical protein